MKSGMESKNKNVQVDNAVSKETDGLSEQNGWKSKPCGQCEDVKLIEHAVEKEHDREGEEGKKIF